MRPHGGRDFNDCEHQQKTREHQQSFRDHDGREDPRHCVNVIAMNRYLARGGEVESESRDDKKIADEFLGPADESPFFRLKRARQIWKGDPWQHVVHCLDGVKRDRVLCDAVAEDLAQRVVQELCRQIMLQVGLGTYVE